jgi:hypothetical protein
MCIVSGEAKVSDTEILSFPTSDGAHQVVVYSNRFDIGGGSFDDGWTLKPHTNRFRGGGERGWASPTSPVAMVLPFPEGPCDMIDLGTDGKRMFSDLGALFPVAASATFGREASRTLSYSATNSALEVRRCGSYRYSIVPTHSDFSRVDASVFRLTSNVVDVLARHYASGFSFLVCIIDETAKYAPIAYRHLMRKKTEMFVPTRHEHGDGSVDWDHAVYLLGNDTMGRAAQDATTDAVLRQVLPRKLAELLPASLRPEEIRKVTIVGGFPNVDLIVPVRVRGGGAAGSFAAKSGIGKREPFGGGGFFQRLLWPSP